MALILSLDQGTTSSRAIIFDKSGTVKSKAQEEFPQIFPEPGLVEHDAKTIWETQLRVARAAIEQCGCSPSEISGIGITNQRETVVIWDRETGAPVANAIVWQDRRTVEYCESLTTEGFAEEIQAITGLVIDAYFSGTKIRWLLENVPGLRERAEAGELAFGTIDSWLIWNLTGGQYHLTDVTNASRTLLFDIHKLDWSERMLEILDVPRPLLPDVRSSSELYATTTTELFGAGIPIAGIAGDQHAALFGQACLKPGMAKNTYGTGCFMLMNTGTKPVKSKHRLLTTIAWQIDGVTEYALEGSIFIGGAVVQWLRDQLGIIKTSEEIEGLAREVEDNGGVYFVPAFAGLGAPHWDGFARGSITGLTRGSNKAHIARAALEGIAFQVNEILKAMVLDSATELTELRVDGGATGNELLMQIQADLLGVPVVRSETAEATALGAAYLAGLATGVWESKEHIADAWAERDRFGPGPGQAKMQADLESWNRAVERTLS